MSADRPLVVIGYGKLAQRLHARWSPRPLLAIRRHGALPVDGMRGDVADPAFWHRTDLPAEPLAVLITATPGLRGGGDGNGLLIAMEQIVARWPRQRLIYTASTAVYGDHGGASVDDDGPVSNDGRAPALRMIEDVLRVQPASLILRVGALVGPSRPPRRAQQAEVHIAGDPRRPFPFIHEDDLIDLLLEAIADPSLVGVLNAVAPHDLSYADYYRGWLGAHGYDPKQIVVHGSPDAQPARRVLASRLWQRLGDRPWRLPWAGCGNVGEEV